MRKSGNCYICGKSITPKSGHTKEIMRLDRKDREVHGRCKLRVEKAQADLRRV